MTDDGITWLLALRSCEQAQAGGSLADEAVELAAAAHGVDPLRLLDLLLAKQYACAEARAAVAGARWADE